MTMSSEDKYELHLESDDPQPTVSFKWSSTKSRLRVIIAAVVVALVIAILAVIGLAIALGVTKSKESETDACTTPECIQLASALMSGLDQSVDPCQDFYNFSCGRWADSTYIPSDASNLGQFDVLMRQNTRALYQVLTRRDDSDIQAVRKAKDLFGLCMNADLANALGPQPLLDLLRETGGWPLIGLPNDAPWDINGPQFMMEKLINSPAFFSISVDMDEMNSSRYIITVRESGLSLDDPSQYDTSIDSQPTDGLQQFIFTMLQMLNPTGDDITFINAADRIIAVETALAQSFEDPVPYNRLTVAQLTSLSPYYDWIGGLETLFATAGITIDATEPVNVQTPSYLTQLGLTLGGFTAEDLQNYARWQLVQSLSTALDDQCAAAYYEFKHAMTTNEIPSRAEMCVDIVRQALPLAVWRPFADEILSQGARSTASEMTTNIMAAFRERVGTRDWLDEETSQRCQRKVDFMRQNVAYPDGLLNDNYLNQQYESFQVFPDNLFQTTVGFLRLTVRLGFARLPNPVDILSVYPNPYEVNAFNVFQINQMVILPGIMNSPFFEASWPAYLRYGAMGSVIGHEITHGFDDTGRLYNETGQLENWWTNASIGNFQDRAQCYIDQYSGYSLFGINVLGNATLGENIADNGGIAVAYAAYQRTISQGGQNQPLPSISYTRDQMFFIGFAQLWCNYYNAAGFQAQVVSDEHSPGPMRVIGTVSNSPEFAEAFQCAPGTPMNPRNKCALW